MLTGLSAPDPRERLSALLALKEADDVPDAAVRAAAQSLWAEAPILRRAALDVLGHLAEHRGVDLPPSVAERARALVEDPSPEVRAEAAASLALIPARGPQDLDARARVLSGRLDDPSAEVRQEAAAALGDLRQMGGQVSDEARARLADTLTDRDPRVRFEAAFALASLGDRRARPTLEVSLTEPQRRLDAIEGLARLGDPAALPRLERLTNRLLIPWVDRLAGLAARARLGDASARARIIDQVAARRWEARVYAVALVGELGLTEGLEAVRSRAAKRGDKAREAAFTALAAIGDAEDLERLSGWSRDPALPLDTRNAAEEAARSLVARLRSGTD